jgi:signal transduction histidine kinase
MADPAFETSTSQTVVAALFQTGVWQAEMRMRRKDGTEFDADIIVNSVIDPSEQVRGSVALIRDISQEKTLQEQKDRFIANASHELRTPLTNLKMRLYLLNKQPDLLREHLPVMERMMVRMQDLVDDLLDVSRFERGVLEINPKTVILQDLIADVIGDQQPHAERKTLQLESQMPPIPMIAFIDPGRITQVLTNLVVNAINYTPEGGRVTVTLASALQDGRRSAVIQVRDTGMGIAPQFLKQIFEPFFRVNAGGTKGTGLGLTITREIVRLHKGTITVESQPDVGTTFTLTLPLNALDGVSAP